MTITAPAIPDIAWFRDPGFTELTPLTVTPDGRVLGHLAGWSTPHRSFPGRNITAPRSRSNYRHFRTGSVQVRDGDDVVEVSAGNLTIGPGHADTHLSAAETSMYYDSACQIVAQVGIGEDAFGVWVAGALMPDVDEITLRRFRACSLSGDWRACDGHLDLVAALAVPTPGFPIPRARVASGAPLALVAAGALAPPAAFGKAVDPAWQPRISDAPVEQVNADMLLAGTLAAVRALEGARIEVRADSEIRFYRADNTEIPGDADALTDEQAALLDAIDDTPALVAALLDEVDETPERVAALLAELDDGEDVSEEDLQALADLAAEDGLDEGAFLSRMPPQLQRSYLTGKVAARIRWNTPGDMTRCMAQAKVHGMGRMAPGACARLHKIATGVWPGDRRNIG